jgi:hypothetical protein
MPFITTYRHVGKAIEMPGEFAFIKNHFIKSYLRTALNEYYAESTGIPTSFARVSARDLKRIKSS